MLRNGVGRLETVFAFPTRSGILGPRMRTAQGKHFLAFDLGAESGRAMLGRLHAGVLDLTQIHRFPNEPVRQNGSMHWDILRLWLEMQRGLERAAGARLESVGLDAWGVDFAYIGE